MRHGARRRSPNNTDYLVCARSESVRTSSRLIKVSLRFPGPSPHPCDTGTDKLSNCLGPTFQRGGGGEKKGEKNKNSIVSKPKTGSWPQTLHRQNTYKAFVVHKRQKKKKTPQLSTGNMFNCNNTVTLDHNHRARSCRVRCHVCSVWCYVAPNHPLKYKTTAADDNGSDVEPPR